MRLEFALAISVGTALVINGQAPRDPEEVLAHARDKILDRTDRLPNYICVQTVDRQYFKRKNPEYPIPSCDKMRGEQDRKAYVLQLEATDRLRLDVKVSDGTEIGAWAGSAAFDDDDIRKLIHGPFGTGGFGVFLADIFTGNGIPFSFQSEELLDGVKLFRYRFQVSRESSHYVVDSGSEWAYTAYDGEVWVDPATFDLRRLMVRTAELPEDTGTCESTTTVDYARTRIGTGDFLLPGHSNLYFLMRDTREDDVGIAYSSCHQFLGEAKLVAEPSAANEQVAAPRAPITIPPGFLVPIKLTQSIDSDTAAAGDAVLATVAKAVRDPVSKKVIIPTGSTVHARLVGMEHWFNENPRFAFTLQLETVEIDGVATPLYARLADAQEAKVTREGNPGLIVRREFYLPPSGQARPVAHHVVYTKDKRYVIPRGHAMTFITVAAPAEE